MIITQNKFKKYPKCILIGRNEKITQLHWH